MTEKRIAAFIEYFRRQQSSIEALAFASGFEGGADNSSCRFYKKVLLITAIDTLAGIRYPQKNYPQLNKRNQERFTTFVLESGVWPEAGLVSIPFVLRQGIVGKGRLLDVLIERYGKPHENREFSVPCGDIDLPLVELLKHTSTEAEQRALHEHQHVSLLYRYRNYLVHESREPGYAMEIGEDEGPYYHGYIGDSRLYLCYPQAHFSTLLRNAIGYLESFLTENGVDPYGFVSDTSAW